MKRILPFFIFIAILLTSQPFQSVSADSLTVNAINDVDDGNCNVTHCSLREAIQYAVPGDTIDFSASISDTIELDGDQLTIDKSLTIDGPGAEILTISANTSSPSKASRVFHLYSAADTLDVSVSGLRIANGDAGTGMGGNIYNDGENLNITNCKIITGTATSGGGSIYNNGTLNISYSTIANSTVSGGPGGGLFNDIDGILTLNNSTVSGNEADRGAGGGAINDGVMFVNNSTFFDNHADGNRYWGGGIGNRGTLTLNHSTLSANSADSSGAGLRHKGDSLNLSNTIIANSLSAGDCQADSDAPVTDGGYNLIEGTGSDACGLVAAVNGNIIGSDPLLVADLDDYGGPTLTLAILFSSSPAWDAIPDGVNGCLAGVSIDQRGESRSGGTDTTGYAACDIGAFEYGSSAGYELNNIYLPLAVK